jgi:hypothetical protein
VEENDFEVMETPEGIDYVVAGTRVKVVEGSGGGK